MNQKSEFEKQAGNYAKYRPLYPEGLFHFLATISLNHSHALDVGTGNGQCANALAKYFAKVTATDISSEQILHAKVQSNICYYACPAEEMPVSNASLDLITAATAAHWFDLPKFFEEAAQKLKPQGVVAFWAYSWHLCESQEISDIILKIGMNELSHYWSAPPKLIWNNYKDLYFPIKEIPTPKFECEAMWTQQDLLNYLGTWSASQKYMEANHCHPAQPYLQQLQAVWPKDQAQLKFTAPLILKVGKF